MSISEVENVVDCDSRLVFVSVRLVSKLFWRPSDAWIGRICRGGGGRETGISWSVGFMTGLFVNPE